MAIPATMLSRSSSSSGSSTPWLSPDASSSTWRTSYSASADLSRRTSSASTTTNRSSIPGSEPSYAHDPNAHEWWEHVLPPGQLAERLRKAQRSSSASRRRNNPALANATPSERSAWKRLSGLPREEPHHDRSASSTAASSRRSSFQGTSATLPRSALRSSLRHADSTAYSHAHHSSQPGSSAEVSSDEYTASPTGRHSPPSNLRYVFPSSTSASAQSGSSRLSGVRTTGNSPDLASSQWAASSSTSSPHAPAVDASHAASRGSYGRRMRVMSEDGMASSVFAHSNAASYRLPSSHSAIHLSHYAATQDRARPASLHQSLPDTPELSSDDGADHVHFATSSSSSSTTTTTQRTRRISTTRTTIRSSLTSPPTILRSDFDRPDQPIFAVGQDEAGSARHERHVSFDTVPEVLRRASVHETPTASHSQPAFNFGSVPGREHSSPFDTLPPRSNSTRRTRHGMRASGGRSTSFSLPGSRRNSILGDRPFEFGHAGAHTAGSSHRRTTSVPDAALLDSLNVAHKQLASAGNLAITLTRQLSAPLRPVLQMTLFLSISSLTVLSLACFLCASYMLTAWDDVSKRSHRVGQVAGKTRHTMGRTLTWGMRMLGPGSGAEGKESKAGNGDAAGAGGVQGETRKRRESASRGAVSAAGHAMLWPARIAWSGASTVAFLVTPPAVSHMFTHGREGQKTKPRSTLPPRPPLSTLLPSILFTLLLALGAGLTSFMASRKAAAAAATAGAGARTEQPASSQPYTVPSPGVQYVHLPAASPFAGGHRASGMRPRSQQSAQRVV